MVFLPEGGDRARLWAVLTNHGKIAHVGQRRMFDLEQTELLADLRNSLVIGWRPHGSELCRWRTAARSARQRTDPAEGSACGLRSACRSRSGHPPGDDLVLVTA